MADKNSTRPVALASGVCAPSWPSRLSPTLVTTWSMTPASGCRSSLRRFLRSLYLLAGTRGILWSVPHCLVLLLALLIDLGGSQLDDVPTVGFSDPIFSYFSALRFHLDTLPMLKYGYEKVNAFVFII